MNRHCPIASFVLALVAVALVAATDRAHGQASAPMDSTSQTIAIVPRPESLTVGRGRFVIGPSTVIFADAATADIARRFAASLFPATGLSIPVRVGTPVGASAMVLARSARLTRLGDEGYELTVTPRRVTIRGSRPSASSYRQTSFAMRKSTASNGRCPLSASSTRPGSRGVARIWTSAATSCRRSS